MTRQGNKVVMPINDVGEYDPVVYKVKSIKHEKNSDIYELESHDGQIINVHGDKFFVTEDQFMEGVLK